MQRLLGLQRFRNSAVHSLALAKTVTNILTEESWSQYRINLIQVGNSHEADVHLLLFGSVHHDEVCQ